MNEIRVPRLGMGRPRKRPSRLRLDRAYGFKKQQQVLRRRGIRCISPEREDAKKHRLAKGSKGGRPPTYDTEAYKERNVIERCINRLKDFRWDLGALNPNCRKWLAKKSSRARADNLGKLQTQARYPQLAAFIQEALYTFTDALLEMQGARLWELHGECRKEFRQDRLAATKTINETMHVLSVLGRRYLGTSPASAAGKLTEGEVRLALKNAERLTRPEDDAYVDYFSKKHRQVQNFSRRLLEVMVFQRNSGDGGLLAGLELVKKIHSGTRRKLPTAAPTGFIPAVWEPEVFDERGQSQLA